MQTVYTVLTRRFNSMEIRAILAGGQAAVLHHIAFMSKDGDWVEQLTPERPLLTVISQGRDALEQALDAERRQLIRANEARLEKYLRASQSWQAVWPALSRQMRGYPLLKAHQLMVQQAEKHLPFSVPGGWP